MTSSVRSFRSASHWAAKFFTSDADRLSDSIRVTCLASPFSDRSSFAPAARISSSSGTLAHRKNDIRDATA